MKGVWWMALTLFISEDKRDEFAETVWPFDSLLEHTNQQGLVKMCTGTVSTEINPSPFKLPHSSPAASGGREWCPPSLGQAKPLLVIAKTERKRAASLLNSVLSAIKQPRPLPQCPHHHTPLSAGSQPTPYFFSFSLFELSKLHCKTRGAGEATSLMATAKHTERQP